MASKRNEELQQDLPPGLGRPAQRALAAAGYTRLDQLARVSEADLLKLHGMGPKAIDQIRAALRARGLSFAGARAPHRPRPPAASRRRPRR